MAISKDNYKKIINELQPNNVTLVAVSKIQPVTAINELYEMGHRDFGENYVQELVEKKDKLPGDIRWHFIGHLQTNKVKYLASFVHLIQGVDSLKLLQEINKQAKKSNRLIHVLLQVHIAQEETKFGFDENELTELLNKIETLELNAVSIDGLMGMATFTDDIEKVRREFQYLKNIFNNNASFQTKNRHLQTLSMGMSDDFKIAIEEGSTMVRIGSLIFGKRKYS
jgi:pyridoxal phosphate enzyme, YggS family